MKGREIRPRLEIAAPGAEVDPREDDLPVTGPGDRRDPFRDLLRGEAPACAPRVGDDAVAAKGVAAVLDLQEGAGVFREDGRPEAGDPLFIPDVADQDPRRACRHFTEDIGNSFLFGVSGDEPDAGDLGDLLRGPLGVAAGDQDGRRRVFPDRPTDELAGLVVGSAGDCTGVDDIAVRRLLERDEGDPAGDERLRDPRRFALVDLAAERRHGDPDHFRFPFAIHSRRQCALSSPFSSPASNRPALRLSR